MRSIGGILGAVTFLLFLATMGAAMFLGDMPNWMILLGAAVVTAIPSVVIFTMSKSSSDQHASEASRNNHPVLLCVGLLRGEIRQAIACTE